MAAIAAIHGDHVCHGTASFETEPPDETEMAQRRQTLMDQSYPWSVAEINAAADAGTRAIGSG